MLQDNEISKSGFVEELRYEYKTGQTIRCFQNCRNDCFKLQKEIFPIFKNEEFYFGELNVFDVAREYIDNEEILQNTYVYDDGAIKGGIRLNQDEIVKLYVEPHFQGEKIGSKLLSFATSDKI